MVFIRSWFAFSVVIVVLVVRLLSVQSYVQLADRSIAGCGASVFDCRSMNAIGKKQAFRYEIDVGNHLSALTPNR